MTDNKRVDIDINANPAGYRTGVDEAKKITRDFNSELAASGKTAGAISSNYGQAAASAEELAEVTVGARREMVVLAHEAVTGNFSRMPGSFMVLAEKMSLTELAAAAVGSALVLGPIAAAALLIPAFMKGRQETEEMNHALEVTGNYAGMTRNSMLELADSVSSTGTITIGTAKDIVTELVNSGRLGADSLKGIAKISSDFAAATGADIHKISAEMIKIFDDPSKGAAELNKQMHFLSTTDQEYIDHLVRIGKEEEARLVLLDKLNERIPKQSENLGTLESAWNGVKNAASSAWDAMLSVGREETVEQKIKGLQEELVRAAQSGNAMRTQFLSGQINLLQNQKASADEIAAGETAAAAATEDRSKWMDSIKKSQDYHIIQLRDELTLIKSQKPANSQEAMLQQSRILEINKEIASIRDKQKTPSGNLYGQEMKDVASLAIEIEKLDDVEKTNVQILQEKLDTFTKMDGPLKDYLQKQLDLAKAAEQLNAFEKASMQGDQNAADADNDEGDADREGLKARQDDFTAFAQRQQEENENLNVAIISSDRKRAQAQLELEHQRQITLINSRVGYEDDIQELLDNEDKNFALRMEELNQQLDNSKGYAKELGFTLQSAFEGAVTKGQSAREVVQGLGQDIIAILGRKFVTDPFAKAVDNFSDSFDGAGFLSSMFSGFGFAAGGRPPLGKASLVGEKGPELFVPDSAGTVIPNDQLGGNNVSVVVNVDASGSSVQGNTESANAVGKRLGAVIRSEVMSMMRPGGELSRG